MFYSSGPPGNTLTPGSVLNEGEELRSNNGFYRMVMQSDKNLVLYNNQNQALWASSTWQASGFSGPVFLKMQDFDNHLVMYDRFDRAVWYSGV